jgi:hypothetical protein
MRKKPFRLIIAYTAHRLHAYSGERPQGENNGFV